MYQDRRAMRKRLDAGLERGGSLFCRHANSSKSGLELVLQHREPVIDASL
jgi:hypothetical protein